MQQAPLTELASGIDALYLSGRAVLPPSLLKRLEEARNRAELQDAPVEVLLGNQYFDLLPRNFGKYRYRLQHQFGLLGITPSEKLPALRFQPRAEFLHGHGPDGAVEWFRDVTEQELGMVRVSVSRVDLYADFQGWDLSGDDREHFICRSSDVVLHESDKAFNGLIFGTRKSSTIGARLYNKTIQSEKLGKDYWKDIWNEHYNPSLPVHRVEFEVNRTALRQFGLDSPEQVFEATGSLWMYCTNEWLTHRVPTEDATRSRWPVSPEYQSVQRASLQQDAIGIERCYAALKAGQLRNLIPQLNGYLASFAALINASDFRELFYVVEGDLNRYNEARDISFAQRIEAKRKQFGLL